MNVCREREGRPFRSFNILAFSDFFLFYFFSKHIFVVDSPTYNDHRHQSMPKDLPLDLRVQTAQFNYKLGKALGASQCAHVPLLGSQRLAMD